MEGRTCLIRIPAGPGYVALLASPTGSRARSPGLVVAIKKESSFQIDGDVVDVDHGLSALFRVAMEQEGNPV
jgi:hypothetical protein